VAIDRAERSTGEAGRRAAHERASLLTPVAKAFATDIGCEVASLGVQVHGGMGYVEETGAAQHYRDARIAPIYEGTNGIQAIDLVTRKLPLSQGGTVQAYLHEIARTVDAVDRVNDAAFGWTGVRLREAHDSLARTTHWLLARAHNDRDAALAGATPYLRLFALTAGGALLAKEALAARRLGGNGGSADANARIAMVRFFAENFAVHAGALERVVTEGADTVATPSPALE
jgi:acyl-CoA dehydrogenase